MSAHIPARGPSGVPAGGQFATHWRAGAAVVLGEGFDDSLEEFDEDHYWPNADPEWEHPAEALVYTIAELCTYKAECNTNGRTNWDRRLPWGRRLVSGFAEDTHLDRELVAVFDCIPGVTARDWMAIAKEGLDAHAEGREPNLRQYLLRAALWKTGFANWPEDATGSPVDLRNCLGEHLDAHFERLTDETYHWTTDPALDPEHGADWFYAWSYAQILHFWADVPTDMAHASLWAKVSPRQVAEYRSREGVEALRMMIALRSG